MSFSCFRGLAAPSSSRLPARDDARRQHTSQFIYFPESVGLVMVFSDLR